MSTAAIIDTTNITTDLLLRNIMKNAKYMNGVPYAEVPVDIIETNARYQRDASGNSARIAREWDNYKAGSVTLSIRDGKAWCVDGQNRVIAAGIHGQETVNAIIYTGLTEQDEARLFAQQMNNVKLLTAYDKLNAGVVAEDHVAMQVYETIKEFKIKLARQTNSRTGYFSAISTAMDAVRMNGKGILVWALTIIEDAKWHDARGAYSSRMMRAIFNMYGKHTTSELVKVFRKTSPNILMAQASVLFPDRGGSSAISAYIETLLANS